MEVWIHPFSDGYILVPVGDKEGMLEGFRIPEFDGVDYYPIQISATDDYWKNAEMFCVVDCVIDENNRLLSALFPDWAAKPSLKERFAAAQAQAKRRESKTTGRDKETIAEEKDKSKFRPER